MEKIGYEKRVVYKKRSARELLTVLFRYRNRILAVFILSFAAATLFSFLKPPVYEAQSSILVKFGREYLSRPEVGNSQPVATLNQEELLNSEVQILKSPDLIRKVVQTLGVARVYPGLAKTPPKGVTALDAAVSEFNKKLVVEGVRKSGVIQVSYQHKDPEIAAAAVNLLVDQSREKHLQVFGGTQSPFLEKQLAVYRQKLKESEKNMQSFKQENRVYSLDEQRSLLLSQRKELDTEYKNAQNSVGELQRKLASLKGQSRRVADNRALYVQPEKERIIVDAKSKLLTLQLTEQELLRKYRENSRVVGDVRQQIRIVKDFLREQEEDVAGKTKTGNAVYQDLERDIIRSEADLNAQSARAASLRSQLSQLDGELRSLDLRETDMQNLKRDLAVNEKNYQVYGDKLEEARISDNMNRLKLANISVIQEAPTPVEPVQPTRSRKIALGALIGLLAGIGVAFLSDSGSQSILSPESAERRLNLKVLAALPYRE